LFFGDGYGDLSDMARWYIGGLLKHAPSLLAFTNPTVNSYHRLVPGYEAPVNLVYSARNRSACIRIPITGSNPKAKRIEFRCPDPSANPYLAFAAMLMAGIDGIQNKIEPLAPVDKDLYELEGADAAAIPQVPGSLPEVLDALESNHDFLTKGGVFTPDLIETWIAYKRSAEVDSPTSTPSRVRALLRHLSRTNAEQFHSRAPRNRGSFFCQGAWTFTIPTQAIACSIEFNSHCLTTSGIFLPANCLQVVINT
jgi:glutamine synthetase